MAHKDDHSSSVFWFSDVDGVSYIQLDKFWSELSPKARQKLLRVDRQALFEQARKNMCCSRCHGLLLEGFLQIVSLQQKGSKDQNNNNSALSNPDAHQWGGLTATRDESLTLLDCYLYPKSFKVLQTVFESARARERERELLYPDACGGDGRVWISQGMSGYGKGHGTRESCALHTRWLSCDTLVDFYSALEDQSRHSLFTMREEDFIGRLTSRFDCKKFCRDCRKNVIREFKALKDLKRMQRKPQCTEWFCVADTAFQYQLKGSKNPPGTSSNPLPPTGLAASLETQPAISWNTRGNEQVGVNESADASPTYSDNTLSSKLRWDLALGDSGSRQAIFAEHAAAHVLPMGVYFPSLCNVIIVSLSFLSYIFIFGLHVAKQKVSSNEKLD